MIENYTKEELIKILTAHEKQKQTAQKFQQENPGYRLCAASKQRAARIGMEFSLTPEDIKIPNKCPLLGVELTNIIGQGRQQYNPSVDRIDSTKGYTPDNIWVISDLANRMKQEATREQLIMFAEGILKLYKENHEH
jgi:hypothetical protein